MKLNVSELLARQDLPYLPIETVTLTHPSFQNNIYPEYGTSWHLVNQPQDERIPIERGKKVDFIATHFAVGIPEKTTEPSSTLGFRMLYATSQMLVELEEAINRPQDPIMFEYRIHKNVNQTAGFYLNLRLTEVAVLDGAITGVAGRSDLINKQFPNKLYTIESFPGLDR